MSDIKYQLFISSTFIDLKDERGKVIESVLRNLHFPIGMEMFSADNEEQWQVIQSTIDSSDLYILIIGHRYGSITTGRGKKISYTEKEFDYAIKNKKNVPVLAFIRDRKVNIDTSLLDPENKKRLDDFIKKVQNSNIVVEQWTTGDNLAEKLVTAMNKIFRKFDKNPASTAGWVKRQDGLPDVRQQRMDEHSANLTLLDNCSEVYRVLEETGARFEVTIEEEATFTFDDNCHCTIERMRTQVCLEDVTHSNFQIKIDEPGEMVIQEVSDISDNRGVGHPLKYVTCFKSDKVLKVAILFDRTIPKGETVVFKTKAYAQNFLTDLIRKGVAEFSYNGLQGTTFRKREEVFIFPNNDVFKNITITLKKVNSNTVNLSQNVDYKILGKNKVFRFNYGTIDGNINSIFELRLN